MPAKSSKPRLSDKLRIGRPLREQAETLLRATPQSLVRLPPDRLQAAVHELQVHQMELEIQNEDLRQMQVALAQSRDRYTDLYEFAPVGYLSIGRDGKILEANLTAVRLLGCDRSALLGARFDAFVLRADRDRFFHFWQSFFSGDHRSMIELQLAASTQAHWVELQAVSGPEPPDRQPSCRAVLVDITERKQAENALRQLNAELERRVAERTAALAAREEDLREFFDGAPVGLMQVDPAGRITWANRAHLEILGLAQDQVVGRNVADFHPDPLEAQELLRDLAQGLAIRDRAARLRDSRERRRHVLVDANGLWQERRLINSRWFVRDITDRRDLEGEILAIAERERERVGLELHDDLGQQLTAIEFAHDSLCNRWPLPTPLAAKQAAEIARMLRQALELTRDLARGLSPAMHLEPDGLASALQDLADRSRRIFQRECHFRGSELKLVKDPVLWVHLFRIAQEALNNAIKHSGATEIEIKLEAEGSTLILSISDNGGGVKDSLPAGPGLGLRIVQYRAGSINGKVAVQSRPGGGTVVVCVVKGVVLTA